MMGLSSGASYSNLERVKQELIFAEDLYYRLGAEVINIENQSIEELSEHILTIYNASFA